MNIKRFFEGNFMILYSKVWMKLSHNMSLVIHLKTMDGKNLYAKFEMGSTNNLREDRNTLVEFIVRYIFESKSNSLSESSSFLTKQML